MSGPSKTKQSAARNPQTPGAMEERVAALETSLRELEASVDTAKLFHHLRVVSSKYWPLHEMTDKATVSQPSSFRIGPTTRPEDIPVPGPYPYLRHQERESDLLQSGCQHVATLKKLLADDGFRLSPGNRVLDFGCFTGRVLRWFLEDARNGVEVWGVDIHAEAIEWVARRMCPPFYTATTTTQPHLPFPDNYFDVIYAGSVFTHIADLADAWLLELRRAMKPQGRAYLTFNDEKSVQIVKSKWRGTWDDTMFDKAVLESGKTLSEVCFISVGQSPYAAVYYNRKFLSEKLSRLFHLKRVHDESYGWQSAYLVQKPA